VSLGTPPKVHGAPLTFTVSAIIEGVYFGLGLLFMPRPLYLIFMTTDISLPELAWVRIIGGIALGLGLGAWWARNADRAAVRLMSGILFVAKGLTALVMLAYLLNGVLPVMFWINFALVALVSIMNARQYVIT